MLTYTGRRTLFGQLANDSSTGTLTLGDTLMNNSERKILAARRWPFLMRQFSYTTTASTQFKELPANCGQVFSVYLTQGTTRHTPKECPSREMWERLNQSTNYTSDFPEYWYQFDGQLGLYPTPATSSLTVSINALRKPVDLSVADYTTGTISAVTNGSDAVTGSGTSWTSGMAGFWLRITRDSAASKGDGIWYEIETVGSTTSITLLKNYTGTTLAAASAAYTIGQVGLLPEDYQILPVYDALRQYFASVKPEPDRAKMYDGLFKEHYQLLIRDWGSSSKNPVLDTGRDGAMTNPNLTVTL